MINLVEEFGQIDIYLFDQILRGRIQPGMRILDAGCGAGRNLVHFLRNEYEVFGFDPDARAVERTCALARSLAPGLSESNFRVEAAETSSFSDGFADVVISSAVLHFARDHGHFQAMLRGTWRLVKPRGLLFCRLASSIGMTKDKFTPMGNGRFRLPDGSHRYLVDEALLARAAIELGGDALEPLKTTVVQNERCMTTWTLRKRP